MTSLRRPAFTSLCANRAVAGAFGRLGHYRIAVQRSGRRAQPCRVQRADSGLQVSRTRDAKAGIRPMTRRPRPHPIADDHCLRRASRHCFQNEGDFRRSPPRLQHQKIATEDFDVVGARQSVARTADRKLYTKHMLRLRRFDNADAYRIGDTVLECLLKNANDILQDRAPETALSATAIGHVN